MSWRNRAGKAIQIFVALLVMACAAAMGRFLVTVEQQPIEIDLKIRVMMEKNRTDLLEVLRIYDNRRMTTSNSPWDLFHGLLGRMHDFVISDANGGTHNCLEWLLQRASWQGLYKGMPLVTERNWGITFIDRPSSDRNKEFEDHFCQFLYILSECDVKPDITTIRVGPQGNIHSVTDLMMGAQAFCNGFSDLSWALPVFAKWSKARKWTNKFGFEFDLDRLLPQHLRREMSCNSCFGTHWRMGLALGLKHGDKKISKNFRIQTEQRLNEAIVEARNSQDASGQFRLLWGLYPPKPPDMNDLPPLPSDPSTLLSHQGHMLEWLMVALSDEELTTQEWPHRGISWLLTKLRDAEQDIPFGTHSHCAHALRLYERRRHNLLEAQ